MIDTSNLEIKKQIGNYYISDKILNQSHLSTTKIGCFKEDTKHLVVIKIFEKGNFSEQNLKKAIEMFQKSQLFLSLAPYNVVKMLDFFHTKTHFYVVEEFCNGGSLAQYLKKKDGYLSEKETFVVFKEIVKAFKWMQEKLILHQGINPNNILLHNDSIKISKCWGKDIAPFIIKSDSLEISQENNIFLAPEQIKADVFSSKSDVFSVGVLIYVLLYGDSPLVVKEETENFINLTKFLKSKELILVDFPNKPFRTEKFKNLIAKMMVKTPEKRISWEQVFESPLLSENQEETKKISEYLEKKNKITKAFWINKIYLDKKRVINQIQEIPENFPEKKIKLSADVMYNSKENVGKLDERKKIKYAKRMDDYLIFERNIAMFYNNLTVQMYRLYETKKFPEMPNDLYNRLLFWLSKYAFLSILKVSDALLGKTEIVSKDKYNVWEHYCNTDFFYNTKKTVESDLEIIDCFYKEIAQKVKEEISNLAKTQKDSFIVKLSLKFLENMEKIETSDGVLLELKEIEKELPMNLMNVIENLNTDNLIITKYADVAAHPYRFFKWNKKNWVAEVDFEKFFEENENSGDISLKTEIKEFWNKNNLI